MPFSVRKFRGAGCQPAAGTGRLATCPTSLRACEKMGTGSGHPERILDIFNDWPVPVPILSQALRLTSEALPQTDERRVMERKSKRKSRIRKRSRSRIKIKIRTSSSSFLVPPLALNLAPNPLLSLNLSLNLNLEVVLASPQKLDSRVMALDSQVT